MITVTGKNGKYSVHSITETLDRFFLKFQPGNSTYLITHFDYSNRQKTILEIEKDRQEAVRQSHLEALLRARKRAARQKTVIDKSDMANNS